MCDTHQLHLINFPEARAKGCNLRGFLQCLNYLMSTHPLCINQPPLHPQPVTAKGHGRRLTSAMGARAAKHQGVKL